MNVSLRKITAESVRDIVNLRVKANQERFIAANAVSLAEALFSQEAWYRAIYLDNIPVGFVMLYDESQRTPAPIESRIAIWRFMVDAKYQGQGIGGAALAQVISHARSKGKFPALLVSYVPGNGGPRDFYQNAGFEPTGDIDEGEYGTPVVTDMWNHQKAS